MKRKYMAALFLLAALGSGAVFAEAAETVPSDMETVLHRAETMKTAPVAAEHFTGSAWAEYGFLPGQGSSAYGGTVTFAPGARTYWHIHSTRQVLIVTQGHGWVQEWGKPAIAIKEGDVVECPPGIKHWHGAAKDSLMTHLAISERMETPVTWLEEVEFSE